MSEKPHGSNIDVADDDFKSVRTWNVLPWKQIVEPKVNQEIGKFLTFRLKYIYFNVLSNK